MEFIGHVLLVIFVALILSAAVMFGFAMLVWFILLAAIISAWLLLREAWRRWWFIHTHPQPKDAPGVIEVDYRDISDEE